MPKPKQSPGVMLKRAFTGQGLKIFLSYILVIELIVLSRGYNLQTVGICLLCAVPVYMVLAVITGWARTNRTQPDGAEPTGPEASDAGGRRDADGRRRGTDPARKY